MCVFGEVVLVCMEIVVWFFVGWGCVGDLVGDGVDFGVSVKKNYLGPC